MICHTCSVIISLGMIQMSFEVVLWSIRVKVHFKSRVLSSMMKGVNKAIVGREKYNEQRRSPARSSSTAVQDYQRVRIDYHPRPSHSSSHAKSRLKASRTPLAGVVPAWPHFFGRAFCSALLRPVYTHQDMNRAQHE